jgi:hypothetical protein
MRTLLLLGALALSWLSTPPPWSALWVAVPGAVALALLLSWRWGPWGVLVPVFLLVSGMAVAGPLTPWAWWIPVAALTGCWMGLREEGGGPPAGQRAWMLLPLLLLAAALPWAVPYPDLLAGLERQFRMFDAWMIETGRESGYQGARLETLRRQVTELAALRQRWLPNLLPTVLFVWMALLVYAGRALASRIAARLRWPELSRARLPEWRLPDGVIWMAIAGLGLLVAGLPGWSATAWTLLLVSGLGYCVQGMAVVECLLLARGIPPSIIVLTFVFVFLMALPVFVLSTVSVGVSDVWLDYRRLESSPDGDSF